MKPTLLHGLTRNLEALCLVGHQRVITDNGLHSFQNVYRGNYFLVEMNEYIACQT
jgi:hypothetical protein